jgi:hypothetical protein
LVGVAVKVAGFAEHTLVAAAAIIRAGVTGPGDTDIVSTLDVAVSVVAQVELLVITQDTASPFTGV